MTTFKEKLNSSERLLVEAIGEIVQAKVAPLGEEIRGVGKGVDGLSRARGVCSV